MYIFGMSIMSYQNLFKKIKITKRDIEKIMWKFLLENFCYGKPLLSYGNPLLGLVIEIHNIPDCGRQGFL